MGLISIINAIFTIFYLLILAHILLSWIRPNPYHPVWGPIMRVVNGVMDPIMAPIRRLLPPLGGLDFSPMIVLVVARLIQGALIKLVV